MLHTGPFKSIKQGKESHVMGNDGQLLATGTFSVAHLLGDYPICPLGQRAQMSDIGFISDVFSRRHEAETDHRVLKSRFICSANIFKSHIWSVTHGRRESELGFWDEGRIKGECDSKLNLKLDETGQIFLKPSW